MKIFGIDPGLRSTGWGVIEAQGHRLIWCGDGMIQPSPKLSDAERLYEISEGITALLVEYQPDHICIEDIFLAKNASSALRLGMARGAALVGAASFGVGVRSISARRMKQNITGSGRADKDQVQAMVSRLLNVTPKGVDSADALAVAIAGMNEQEVEPNASIEQTSGLTSAINAALAKEATKGI